MTYPFRRVVVAFTLCPALVGLFMFGYFATIGLVFQTSDTSVLEMLAGSFGFGILAAITSLIFYGIPALGLSLLYAQLRLHRCFVHLLIVCLAGGAGAQAWFEVLPMENRGSPYSSFFLGVVTSFLMALYALPKQSPSR